MLHSVTPLTLELIEFILKQQIFLKHDRWDVIFNQVALLSFFPPSFPDSVATFLLFELILTFHQCQVFSWVLIGL